MTCSAMLSSAGWSPMVTAPTATTPAVNGALIRKGIALAVHPDGIRFGEWLVRELRGLIKAVAEDKDHTILNPIQARLKRACKLHRDHETEKIRALAREILNDWSAIVAFVTNHALPPTNNEAERALRLAVIARRLSFGTRTEEGSAAYAATLSVVGPSGNAAGDKPAEGAASIPGHTSPTLSPAPERTCITSRFLSQFERKGGERLRLIELVAGNETGGVMRVPLL